MSLSEKAARRALERLFLGELSPGVHAELRAHTSTCDSCRSLYNRVSRVSAALEDTRGGLPAANAASVEHALFERLHLPAHQPSDSGLWRTLARLSPIAGMAAAVLLVAILPTGALDEFAPRGAARHGYGVRAFCIRPSPTPHIIGEAGPGETLRCPTAAAVQLVYSASARSTLEISANGQAHAPPVDVEPGANVPLGFSTPVSMDWAAEPVTLLARFAHPETKQVVGEVRITVVARQAP